MRVIKDQRLAFLAVGGFNTLVGFGTFAGFDLLLGSSTLWRTWATLLLSHTVSVIIAFFLYRYLVFRVRGHFLRDAWRFETVYLTSLVLNMGLLSVAVHVLHLPQLASQLVITALMAVVSYVGHHRFSFRR